jgi:hypothetical protein
MFSFFFKSIWGGTDACAPPLPQPAGIKKTTTIPELRAKYMVRAGMMPEEVVMVYFMSGFDGGRKKHERTREHAEMSPPPPPPDCSQYQPSPLDFQTSTLI